MKQVLEVEHPGIRPVEGMFADGIEFEDDPTGEILPGLLIDDAHEIESVAILRDPFVRGLDPAEHGPDGAHRLGGINPIQPVDRLREAGVSVEHLTPDARPGAEAELGGDIIIHPEDPQAETRAALGHLAPDVPVP